MLDLNLLCFWSFGAFYFYREFIFVFRSTQIPFHHFHCVFLLVYLAVFFPDLQNPLFCITLCWLFCLRKLFSHIRKFWASGFCKIAVLEKRKKKNQFKKTNRKKNDKYYKNNVQSWRYNWRNWALILENLLKTNGACVWSEGQLSINQWKSHSLDHNNYFSGAVFWFWNQI